MLPAAFALLNLLTEAGTVFPRSIQRSSQSLCADRHDSPSRRLSWRIQTVGNNGGCPAWFCGAGPVDPSDAMSGGCGDHFLPLSGERGDLLQARDLWEDGCIFALWPLPLPFRGVAPQGLLWGVAMNIKGVLRSSSLGLLPISNECQIAWGFLLMWSGGAGVGNPQEPPQTKTTEGRRL